MWASRRMGASPVSRPRRRATRLPFVGASSGTRTWTSSSGKPAARRTRAAARAATVLSPRSVLVVLISTNSSRSERASSMYSGGEVFWALSTAGTKCVAANTSVAQYAAATRGFFMSSGLRFVGRSIDRDAGIRWAGMQGLEGVRRTCARQAETAAGRCGNGRWAGCLRWAAGRGLTGPRATLRAGRRLKTGRPSGTAGPNSR